MGNSNRATKEEILQQNTKFYGRVSTAYEHLLNMRIEGARNYFSYARCDARNGERLGCPEEQLKIWKSVLDNLEADINDRERR